MNIYAPNDQAQQVHFLRDLSNTILNTYANERLVLGGDFNCALNKFDKQGGRSIEHTHTKKVIQEMNHLINTHDLIDTWRECNFNLQGFTWRNPSKIQCRLDYFVILKDMRSSLPSDEIVPNIFSDHSALSVSLGPDEEQAKRGPGSISSILRC